MFYLRKTKLSDINNIIDLTSKNLEENAVPLVYLNDLYDIDFNFNYVCFNNNKLIGIVSCTISNHILKINCLCIDFPFQGKGFGTILLDRIKSDCNSTLNSRKNTKYFINKIRLHVRSDNVKAQEFYKKHGFQIIDNQSNYYNKN